MKKKIIIGVIITTIVLLIIMVFIGINTSDSNDYFYEDYEHPMIAGQAITPYKCRICRQKYDHPNTATPKICSTCATITNRCNYCGKLKRAE